MTARRAPWLLGGLALAGLLTWALWPASPSSDPVSAPAPGARPLRFVVPEGQTFQYHWTFAQENRTHTFAGQNGDVPVTATMDLAVDVDITGRGGTDLIEADIQFARFVRHDVRAQDKPLLDEPAVRAALLGPAARVRFARDGRVRSLSVAQGAPPMFERLVQMLLGETQMQLGAGETWTVSEDTLHGRASATYTRGPDEDGGARLQKARTGYAQLRVGQIVPTVGPARVDAAYTISLDADGALLAHRGHERLTAALPTGQEVLHVDTEVALVRGAARPAARVAAAPLEPVQVGDPALSADVERDALRRQADGLTAAQVLADLNEHGLGGMVPDHNRWLWRAVAALQLEPARAADIAAYAMRTDVNTEARELALDLLVGAGHPAAQAALIRALQSPAVKGDRSYALLYQRLNLVTSPTPDLVAFAEATRERGSPLERRLATNTLGSAAGHLVHSAEPQEGYRIAQGLADELAAAEEEDEQEVLLIALGNAALEEHGALVMGHRGSASSTVRHASAVAMRKLASDETRDALLQMVIDPVERVQIRALVSLDVRKDLTAADRLQLHQWVMERRIHEGAYPSLITLLGRYLKDDPQVATTFRTMLRQDLKDSEIKVRLTAMLGG